MGLKDLIVRAVTKRFGSGSGDVARDVLESDAAKGIVDEVLRSETAKELARDLARESAREAAERVKQEERKLASPLTERLDKRRAELARQRAEAAREEAERREAEEIDEELAAIKRKLGRS